MELLTEEQVERYIASLDVIQRTKMVTVQRLSGGISCLVWKVTADDEKWVLKQALGKLNVDENWFADVRRIEREQHAMWFLEPMMPEGTIPRIIHSDAINHVYMMNCAPEEAIPWKNRLMEGEFQSEAARQAGLLLRAMHENSRRFADQEQQEAFGDMTFFRELRIEPFHRHLIRKYPELGSNLEALISDLEENRTCLVHGDFSPKNMLVDNRQRVILLDYEVAHWGNPVFDLAFLLAHLLLKGWVLGKHIDALQMIERFLEAYEFNQERHAQLIGHTGALLLSRIDGKSTVDYVKEQKLKDLIRQTAIHWIQHPDDDVFMKLRKAMKG
ncbi:phosphotransferase family protein [Paenibacillus sp. GCM10027629]|uniref:phosphotransferase family protein n=1 Tax=Paenibacillus sp. GCM10027629 TaxID=3273414 RepID=UPI0036359E1D